MSQLLQVATRKGNVSIFAGPPVFFDQGIPYADIDQIAIAPSGVIDHYHQGLPFTSTGELAAVVGVAVVRFGSGGAPFSATGHLCFGTGAIDHYSAGIPYTVNGQIKSG